MVFNHTHRAFYGKCIVISFSSSIQVKTCPAVSNCEQVGYKDESRVHRCRVEKSNVIVNALNRTKREEHPDLAALQEERAKEHRR